MLTNSCVEKVFQEIRGEFLYPPVAVKFSNDPNCIPDIDRMRMTVNTVHFEDEEHCGCVIRHELGHIQYAPMTIRKHKEHLKNIAELLGLDFDKPADGDILLGLANVIYDMLVEYCLILYHNNNFRHNWECTGRFFKKHRNGKVPINNPLWVGLAGYCSVLADNNLFNLNEEALELGRNALKIVRSSLPLDKKVTEIALLFKDACKKEADKQNKAIEEFIKEMVEALKAVVKQMGKNMDGNPATMESMQGEEEVKRASLEAMDTPQKSEKGERLEEELIKCICRGAGLEIKDVEVLRTKSRKRLSFKIKPNVGNNGKSMKAGWELWSPESEVSILDMEETLQSFGIAVPGVTTLASIRRPGKVESASGFPRVWMCIDTSGSMDAKRTSLAIFTLIETARHFKAECGLVMFADKHQAYTPTIRYNELKEKVLKDYGRAGCGNDTPGCDVLVPMVKKSDLIVYVSDFGFHNNHIEQAGELLHQTLPSMGCQVATIVMFQKSWLETVLKKFPDFKYVFCEDIRQLAGMTIETVAGRIAA